MDPSKLLSDLGTWKSLAGVVAVVLGAVGMGSISGQVQDALIGAGTTLIAVDHVVLAFRHRTVVSANATLKAAKVAPPPVSSEPVPTKG